MKLPESDLRVQCCNALQNVAESCNIGFEAYPELWDLKLESTPTYYHYTVIGELKFIVGEVAHPYWFAYSRVEKDVDMVCQVKITFITPDPGATVVDSEFYAPQQDFTAAFAEETFDHFTQIQEAKNA